MCPGMASWGEFGYGRQGMSRLGKFWLVGACYGRLCVLLRFVESRSVGVSWVLVRQAR